MPHSDCSAPHGAASTRVVIPPGPAGTGKVTVTLRRALARIGADGWLLPSHAIVLEIARHVPDSPIVRYDLP